MTLHRTRTEGSLILVLWLVLPSVLRAQDSSRAACDSAATAVNVRRCFEHALQTAERDLQRSVDEARRRAANRALLDSAEAAWRRYRDLACRAAGSQEHGGTTQGPAVLRCLLDLTRRRMRDVYRHYLRASDAALPEP